MGSILITQEGVETSTIQESCRNESIYNFDMMLDEAVRIGDRCFMLEEAYQHKYSYGDYFPAFVNLSWEEFCQNESLRGVSQSTYNKITNSFRNFYPKIVISEEEFDKERTPRGRGGFEHSDSSEDFLCKLKHWDRWHCNHLTAHPDEIQWNGAFFIPNVKKVYEILKEEILQYIRRKYETRIGNATNKEQEINKIYEELFKDKAYHVNEDIKEKLKSNAIALLFHKVVMHSLKTHPDMTAYCKKIGKRVCEVNYYQYEKDLSSKEQQRCASLRCIYGIIKNGEKQYISLDFHKGMFEFHDFSGRHLGEFYFDGTWNKKGEESHNLKTP